jgi:DNA-binding MarR family transcriptional regulator
MPKEKSSTHITELTEILNQFFLLKARLKVVLPEDLARAKMRLDQSRGDANIADHKLIYNIGMALSGRQAPMTMGELGQALGVPLSTATRTVDWLVKNNYVERQPDPHDRRVVRVALTETGRATCRAGSELLQKRAEQLLRPFTAAERTTLIALLHKLIAAMAEQA